MILWAEFTPECRRQTESFSAGGIGLMADTSLSIDIRTLKRVDVVTATGRIDSSNATEFDEALKGIMGQGRHRIVLELSNVSYMSSACLSSRVAALRQCKKRNGDVRLAALSERVRDVLSLAGLDSLFTVFDDTTAAVGSF
jgi:anti-sigma B factor antagonist